MRAGAWILLLVAACQANQDDFPVSPGGGGAGAGGGGGSQYDDGGVTDGPPLIGRVCVAPDLRQPTTDCATTGADGIEVTLAGRVAETIADGTFAIEAPSGSNLEWRVTAPGLVTSIVPFSLDTVLPAITTDDYDDLLLANGVVLSPGQGSILARVVQTGEPLRDAIAAVEPAAQFATFYDGQSARVWDLDATGALGAAWVTGATAGPTALQVTPEDDELAQSLTFGVEDGAITFVTVDIPEEAP